MTLMQDPHECTFPTHQERRIVVAGLTMEHRSELQLAVDTKGEEVWPSAAAHALGIDEKS